jgi:hypothetical protein
MDNNGEQKDGMVIPPNGASEGIAASDLTQRVILLLDKPCAIHRQYLFLESYLFSTHSIQQ